MRFRLFPILLLASAGCTREPPIAQSQSPLAPIETAAAKDIASENSSEANAKGTRPLNAQAKLVRLANRGFAMAGESVPLGFDVARISPTTSKMPNGIDVELRTLFAESWPSGFFLGAIEIIGPDRINSEHKDLYPGLTIIQHGFICIGSDGAGTMFAYCTSDRRVYLLPNEYFGDDGLRSHHWDKLETNVENIKSVATRSWDSLDSLFDWALVELQKLENDQERLRKDGKD